MAGLDVLLLMLSLVGAGLASQTARDFWNIDCGGNSTFTAANGLNFEGDGPYIGTGVSRQVPEAATNGESAELLTLRAFPQERWTKNCYRVPVEQGTKVLVRTQHYYGNYDGLNTPPSFYIHFDTSYGCRFTAVSWPHAVCEAVYVTTKTQGTDICLVQTRDDQIPFVSAIEVSRLQPNMYGYLGFSFSSYSLLLSSRFAFGANESIAYPEDPYNRNWDPESLTGIYEPVIREIPTDVSTRGLDNSPPALLFRAALVAPVLENRTAANLTIPTTWLSDEPVDIYFTMYFTEPVAHDGASAPRQRVFNVYRDGQLFSNESDPIRPTYGSVTDFSGFMPESSNETVIELVPAKGSTLPAAISGMEIFERLDRINATNSNDIAVLLMLQKRFTILMSWTGDPCFPPDYNWEWVNCKYPDNSSPRINQLLLSGFQLSGNIPDFSSLDALEVVNLSNNSFTGSLPEFIASLPNLQTLELADNDFDSIPSSLCNNSNKTVITKGNRKLGPCPSLLSGMTPTSAPTGACNKVGSSKLVSVLLLLVAAMV